MRNLPCQNADCLEVNVSASHLSLFLKCGFRGSCLPQLWYLKLSFVCWFTLKMWKIMYVSALRENTRSEWNNVFLPWNSTMKNEQTLIHFWLPTCIPWIYKIKGPHQTKYLCTMIIIQICVEFIWGFMLTNWPHWLYPLPYSDRIAGLSQTSEKAFSVLTLCSEEEENVPFRSTDA